MVLGDNDDEDDHTEPVAQGEPETEGLTSPQLLENFFRLLGQLDTAALLDDLFSIENPIEFDDPPSPARLTAMQLSPALISSGSLR